MPSNPYYVSPFGTVGQHPWINKADTKFNSDGLFHYDHVMEASPETDDFVACVTEASEAALEDERSRMTPGEAKKWTLYNPVQPEEDADGNPTGRYVASFKQNQVLKLRDGTTKMVKIAVKDASGQKDVRKPVFSGSVVRALYSMRPAKIASGKQVGVRLDFSAVQVKKLAEMGGGSRFGAVDGGYEADERDQEGFDPGDDSVVAAPGGDY